MLYREEKTEIKYPFRIYYPECGMHELKNTELLELLNKIKDKDSTIENPTFNRHIKVLDSLFEEGCKIAELPYRTVAEYHDYMVRMEKKKQQMQEQKLEKEKNDGEAASRILTQFKKQ